MHRLWWWDRNTLSQTTRNGPSSASLTTSLKSKLSPHRNPIPTSNLIPGSLMPTCATFKKNASPPPEQFSFTANNSQHSWKPGGRRPDATPLNPSVLIRSKPSCEPIFDTLPHTLSHWLACSVCSFATAQNRNTCRRTFLVWFLPSDATTTLP